MVPISSQPEPLPVLAPVASSQAAPRSPEPPVADAPLPKRRASLLETIRVVAWSFIGIRRRADHDRDAAHLHPLGVIAVGIGMAALFVLTLLAVVRAVVALT
jgi:hypothetical protein